MYTDDDQKQAFESALTRAQKVWDKPIVTEIVPLETFYIAEPEHQDYYKKNSDTGYCQIVIDPKITHTRKKYKEWFKEE
jgi:peptide-methionine (S)-S-oxide reductase